jgi:hypothetical protein
MQWGDIGEPGKTSTSYTADTTTVTQVDMLKADVDRLTIELGNVCRERDELKDLVREASNILDTIVPDVFAVGKMIHSLSKWKQRADKAMGESE